MNKKQKKVLKRIIVAAVLLVIIGIAGSIVSIPKWLEFLFLSGSVFCDRL